MSKMKSTHGPQRAAISNAESALRKHVLAALRAFPQNEFALYNFIVGDGGPRHGAYHLASVNEHQASVLFADTLALLQTDGLISHSVHPIANRRRYYLTEKGSEVERATSSARGDIAPVRRRIRSDR